MRLDKYLVEKGYYESRNRALEAIKSGHVKVDGKTPKPSLKIDESMSIEVESEKFYVSRAAKKLENFLVEYPVNFSDKIALDIGSSTGGFAQIVLEGGARSIDCVDVGRDQLHSSLQSDDRLSLYEEIDIREFQSDKKFTLITCDVSFISILQIIEEIDRLSRIGTDIVILYKPQYEVGRIAKRDSRGVVVDEELIAMKKVEFQESTDRLNWSLKHQALSQVTGKEGNKEYFFHFVKN